MLQFFQHVQDRLNEDVRWYIHELYHQRRCRVCDTVVSQRGRVRMCIVRDHALCFICWNRMRWPK